MTTNHQHTSASDDAAELVETFARQLAAVRRRLHSLQGRSDAIARIERPLLLEQESAWQRGIDLLQLSRVLGARHIAGILSRWAEGSVPGREVYATMAAMTAIRAAWEATTSGYERTFSGEEFDN